jgi:hypothetical protein
MRVVVCWQRPVADGAVVVVVGAVVVVVGAVVVVVVEVVVVEAGVVVVDVVTVNEPAAAFQKYSVPHPGENRPTCIEWAPTGSPAGTVHVAVNVRATPAVNAWLSHTWVNVRA